MQDTVFKAVTHLGLIGESTVHAFLQRLVPDELWELFQRAVPPAPTRPQGGGRRLVGGRVILSAIVYVATTGCAWRQLPPVSAPPGRRCTAASPSGAPRGCGPSCTGSCWTSSAPEESWSGRGARLTR